MVLRVDPPVQRWLEATARRPWLRTGLLWLRRVLLLAPVVYLGVVIARTTRHPAPDPLVVSEVAMRFGIPEAQRRAIFREIASHETAWRQQAESRFRGDPWSQQDDYSSFVARHVLNVASRRKVHYTVIYMILDEGVRNHWPGPDGKPLPATATPLRPRTQ